MAGRSKVDPAVRPEWARKLAARRTEVGLSQAQFAERVGAAQSTVGSWETGQNLVRQPMWAAIDRVLGAGFCVSLFSDLPAPELPPELRHPPIGLDAKIAALWNAYLGGGREIAPADVQQMFKLVEIAKAGS